MRYKLNKDSHESATSEKSSVLHYLFKARKVGQVGWRIFTIPTFVTPFHIYK